VVRGLQEEGEEPVLVLWALSREVRTICQIQAAGGPADGVLRKHGVFGPRQPMIAAAARRGSAARWEALLARCARVDRSIKGLEAGRPWQELLQLALAIAATGERRPTA